MKAAAHIQAVIELIDATLARPHVPADQVFHSYCRSRRYMGSSDRRAITEIFYSVLRQWPMLEWLSPTINGRLALLIYYCIENTKSLDILFDGSEFGPSAIRAEEKKFLSTLSVEKAPISAKVGAPLWLWPELCVWGEETARKLCESMQQQAPFDVRANPLKTSRQKLQEKFYKKNLLCSQTAYSPLGLRFEKRVDLAQNTLFKEGLAEVQDEGSQLVALLCDAKPGQRVMDFCAGAGGKSLVLAACMENKGTLFLADIHPWRLTKAQERLKRAGVHNYRCQVLPDNTFIKRQVGSFDRVLVDSPCSGTGTWRRNPDLKMKLTKDHLESLIQEQKTILQQASTLVRAGGMLIYATCSVLRSENQEQVENFLANNKDFSLLDIQNLWDQTVGTPFPFTEKTLQLFPHSHKTDGFFVACLQKNEKA
jgi:16S rRNA (cytosine967-C5)-methyltransferase